MKLRDYQIQAIQGIQEAWAQHHTNVMVQLATGAGKTVIFSNIIQQEKTGYAIAIAHRVELVSQISLTLARHGVRHNILAQNNSIREIIAMHMIEVGHSYYDPHSRHVVAGVDTLIRLNPDTDWFKRITLVIQDEGHHVLKTNKWGKAAQLFPNARGLYPTATPCRADGCGLGRGADGLMDKLILGSSMRDLIKRGYLTEYRIFAPPSDLNLTQVPITEGGDYSPTKLRTAVHKSHITGDVVKHYLRIAPGKLGVTFAVDIEAATEIAAEFRAAGVPAEVISSHTPALLRTQIMKRFRQREILQLVNVDLLGEGVDVPAIEVVSMARPTQSYGLYSQQFGRALRPMEGKTHAVIIDHVNNVLLHGLPDAKRVWSLERKDRRTRHTGNNDIPLRVCANVACLAVYPANHKFCPECGYYHPPSQRSAPEYVDGDLTELDPEVLARLRGEIDRIDSPPKIPGYLDGIAAAGLTKQHRARQLAQHSLRSSIAQWAGILHAEGVDDSEIYRTFYHTFGTDIATAQTLGARLAEELKLAIDQHGNKR